MAEISLHGRDEIGSNVSYAFGGFVLSPERMALSLDGHDVPLGSRAFALLHKLVERAGEVVGVRELLDLVWPGQIVHEANLRVQMNGLRKALAPGIDGQPIKTLPMQGYVFVVPVTKRSYESATVTSLLGRLDASQSQVPLALTPVLGRDEVIEHLLKALDANRLVSIVGPGGIGKTTVAHAVARQRGFAHPDGVHVIELSSVSDSRLVEGALAAGFGIPVLSDQPIGGIVAFLRNKRALILLDTCEHLLDAVASLTERLLSACPDITILTTSREALRAEGEWVHRLASLPVPPQMVGMTLEQAREYPAADLFVRRVRAGGTHDELGHVDVPAIISICRRLDGIPLALEFAAARVEELGLATVSDRLDDRFSVLTKGRRTALPRHQTLGATLDWSFDLLSESEAQLLRRLSVFPGRFAVDAAAAVAQSSEADAKSHLSSLFEKSLVTADISGEVVQYRLLDTIRAYTAVKLASAGEVDATSRHHATHMLTTMRQAEQDWDNQDSTVWRQHYARLIDDVRVALDWAGSPFGDANLAAQIAASSSPLWFSLSLLGEYSRRLEITLSLTTNADIAPATRIRLADALGHCQWHSRGDMPAMAATFRSALEGARRHGIPDAELSALWGLLVWANTDGEYSEAVEILEEFRRIASTLDDPKVALIYRRMAALAFSYAGDFARSREHAEFVLAHPSSKGRSARQKGLQFDQRITASTQLARNLWLQGYPDQAWRSAQEALHLAQTTDHGLSTCFVLANAAAPVAFWRGDREQARAMTEILLATTEEYSFAIWKTFGRAFAAVLQNDRGVDKVLSDHPTVGKHLLELIATIDETTAKTAILERAELELTGWSTAELLRIKASRQLAKGDELEAVEVGLRRAMAVADRQGALSWQLRAACSLGEMWSRTGRYVDAIDLVAPLHDAFTEGHETADLVRARAIVERRSDVQ